MSEKVTLDWVRTYHDVHVELPNELDFLGVGLLCETRVIGIAVDLLGLFDRRSLDVIGVWFLFIDGETMRVIDQVVGVSDLSRIHRKEWYRLFSIRLEDARDE